MNRSRSLSHAVVGLPSRGLDLHPTGSTADLTPWPGDRRSGLQTTASLPLENDASARTCQAHVGRTASTTADGRPSQQEGSIGKLQVRSTCPVELRLAPASVVIIDGWCVPETTNGGYISSPSRADIEATLVLPIDCLTPSDPCEYVFVFMSCRPPRKARRGRL